MKIITKISLATVPAIILVLGGCGTDPVKEPIAPPPPTESAQITPPPTEEPTRAMTSTVKPEPINPLEVGLLSQRVIYFEYDSSTVNSDSMELVEAHAQYLSGSTGTTFTLEGHADERGTREYNIALGERRADSVRRLLIANGVAESQIQIVSYGEERPAQLGHNEEIWQANRRAVFAY